MPVLSCGGMRYQHKWEDVALGEIPAENQRNLDGCIHRALELGINHIETARGYGTSEMQLGQVLPRLAREKLIVQTKVPPKAGAAEFLEIFERSMGYLKLDHVDLLSLHGINNRELLDWSLRRGGCLEAARRLQREGRCRFIGFSTHATTDVILDAVQTGEFDYVNLHWYFVNDLNWPAVQAARQQDMGVFIISPNDKGGKLYEPPRRLVELCAPLSPMQFNDLYCLARPEVHTLSCGVARPSDFDEHIAALDHYDRAAELSSPIAARLVEAIQQAVGEAWWRGWWRSLPHYTVAPGGINVQEILRLWTYAKGLDLVDWAKMRYNLMGNAEHWFPGNNAAHAQELDWQDSLKACPMAERIPEVLAEAHRWLFEKPVQRLSQS